MQRWIFFGDGNQVYTEKKLKEEIKKAVSDAWLANTPVLLSNLGLNEISQEGRSYIRENGIRLKHFVRSELADEVRFVPMKRYGGGLVPLKGTEGLSDRDLEARYVPKVAVPSVEGRRPRFHADVWAAFRDALPNDQRRVLSTAAGEPKLQLKSLSAAIAEDEHAIEKSDLAAGTHDGQPASAAEIRAAITNWCEANGVHIDDLMQPAQATEFDDTRERRSRHGVQSASISFLQVLRAVPRERLATISIPGDVLLSVMERLNRR
jgi:hypothetical protein